MEYKDLRKDYPEKPLRKNQLDKNPLKQFRDWLDEAIKSEIYEPNAFSLATSTSDGRPSIRTVLLKDIDDLGIIFFTNYESRKAKQIEENPNVAAKFWWDKLHRQVCIEGSIEKISETNSDDYFLIRPHGAQVSVWASHQDTIVDSREILINNFEKYSHLYESKNVPRPHYWGGYRIIPDYFEFWQGQPNRLHDRFRYTKDDHVWKSVRLSP